MNNKNSASSSARILYFHLLRHQRIGIGSYFFLLLITSGLQLPIPFYLSDLIDGLSKGASVVILAKYITSIVGLSILSLLLSIIAKIYSAKLNEIFLIAIRLTVFNSLQKTSAKFKREYSTTDLQTRLTADVSSLNQFLPTGLAEALRNACFVLALGGILIYTSPIIVLYIAGFLPLAIILFGITSRRLTYLANEARSSYSETNATVQESLMSFHESQITGTEAYHLKRLRHSLERSESKFFLARRYSALMVGLLGVIPILVTAMIWVVGGEKVDAHEMSVGQLVSFLLILTMLYSPISELFNVASGYVYELAAFRRIANLFQIESNLVIKPSTQNELPLLDVEKSSMHFELKKVTFTYDSNPIIEELTMVLMRGACTALMGANGAGKSTLLLLLSRLEVPSSGAIYLNNTLLSTLPHCAITSQYGYAPQNSLIFGDTLRMNITMGRDIPDDNIFDIIANVGWDDLISNWNQNLDTKILENGRDLSGGQKQKIVLLRALVNKPSILLLDEPEKNLDNHSLIKLTEYLMKIKGRCTIILVSHSNVFKDVIDQKIQIN
jgi:ABC-type bacteriocin/lantibiotic exporter with double-glycine peptidase domain